MSVDRPYRLESEAVRQSGHRHFVERKRTRSVATEAAAIEAARRDLADGWCPFVSMASDAGRVIVFDWLEEVSLA